MDRDKYLERYLSIKTYDDKEALYGDVLEADNECRKLFSQQRESWVVPEFSDGYRSLIPVHRHEQLFGCRAPFPEDNEVPKVFPLQERKAEGARTVASLADMKRNFEDLFTEGLLKFMNWDNVFAAGGAVMACLQPFPPEHDDGNRKRRKYLHDIGFPAADVDLFLYGLDEEGAKQKILEIYDAVRDTNPFDVLCFRSAHTVTIVSEYPFRHIQIILRLYSSPFEVLAGFDVDSCAAGYDGKEAWVTPRCHLALVTQSNPINLSRRSPTYEMRLAKYAARGFEVPVPGLQKERIDPTLFEKPWHKVVGLGKLLLLERLRTPEARFRYKEQHRTRRMKPLYTSSFAERFNYRRMVHNKWVGQRMEEVHGGADASDYSTVFLPWGRGYNAKRCATLMRVKDAVLNNPYISKNRPYKLHPCFIGTAEEVIKDCCPDDPPIPDDVDPASLEGFVRGPLAFIEDDPGRQMIGSFHPLDPGEWASGAYITEEMESLSIAANENDLETAVKLVEGGTYVDSLDYAGRTPLHIAAFTGSTDVAKYLVDKGASLLKRLGDGRTPLHVAAAYGFTEIVKLLVEKNIANKEAQKADKEDREGSGANEPQVLDLDAEDWDRLMTPLHYSILFGHVHVVSFLLDAGANANHGWCVKEPSIENVDDVAKVVSIGILLLGLCDCAPVKSKQILKLLVDHGYEYTKLDGELQNLLHLAALQGNATLLSQLLEVCPDMKEKCLNVLSLHKQTPLICAIESNHVECVKLLLEAGAKAVVDDKECELARERANLVQTADWEHRCRLQELAQVRSAGDVSQPIWLAVKHIGDRIGSVTDALNILAEEEQKAAEGGRTEPIARGTKDPFAILKLLLEYQADPNVLLPKSVRQDRPSTAVDYVNQQITSLQEQIKSAEDQREQSKKNLVKVEEGGAPDDPTAQTARTTRESHGVIVDESSGLPANFKSDSIENRYLNEGIIPLDSYLYPCVKATALGKAAAILAQTVSTPWNNEEHLCTVNSFKKLLQILEAAGGKSSKELKKLGVLVGEDSDDESEPEESTKRRKSKKLPKPKALAFEDLTQDYKTIPPLLKGAASQLYYYKTYPFLLPAALQPKCHELFEAAWKGQTDWIEQLTLQAPPTVQIPVAVYNRYYQTPLMLALVRGHLNTASRILEICAQQYTPLILPKSETKPEEPYDPKKFNNYALELFAEDLGVSSQDSDDMDTDGSIADDIIDEMQEGANSAAISAAVTAQGHEGIKTDVDPDFVCHTSPEALLKVSSTIPASLLNHKLPESMRFDPSHVMCLMWKAMLSMDSSAAEILKNNYGVYVHPKSQPGIPNIGTFVSVSALEYSILVGCKDRAKMILDSCESWDRIWKRRAIEQQLSKVMNVGTAEATGCGESEDWRREDGTALVDVTCLASELVKGEAFSNFTVDCLLQMDDPEMLEYLLERTGGFFHYECMMETVEEYAKAYKAGNFEIQKLRGVTILHKAAFLGAEKTVKWVLRKGGEKAFKKFLQRSQESRSSRRAMKLGHAIISNKFTGLAQLQDPSTALATLFCGSVSMEDVGKRTPFHYAVIADHPEMIELLIEEADRRQERDAAIQALNQARIVEKYNPKQGIFRQAHHCGTNALQSSILKSRMRCMKTLLDLGVYIFPEDGMAERGWNLLTFAICSQAGNENNAPIETVKALLDHPRISNEVRQKMICERMGSGKVTPLMVATSRLCGDIVKLLRSYLPPGEMLQQDCYGSTALHIAVRKNGWGVVPALLDGLDHQGMASEDHDDFSEIQELVSAEDCVGLTALDIGITTACSAGQQMGRAPQNHRNFNQHEWVPIMQTILNVHDRLKDSNPSQGRKRPAFGQVQAGLSKTIKEANDDVDDGGILKGIEPQSNLVHYGYDDLNYVGVETFNARNRYHMAP